ncbi:LOW QUALITY PROTEIN: hypothetical protein YC2023_024807 [Brassica napus]
MKKHLVSVQDGISLLIRVDVSDNTRDSMLKELIDIRNSILATEKKCEQAGFTISRMIDFGRKKKMKKISGRKMMVGSDPVKKVAPLPRVQNGEGSSSEANRSTLESLQQGVQVRRSGDPLRDKLISEAPVMNWGSQLSNWDSTTEVNSRLRANHRGIEVESHWGRVDQDAVIPADKIAALNLQASVYREERTEIPPCHAPLKKGGLCQRRDLRACPFHGPIVPRDDEENPIIKESSLEESQNQTSSSTTRISQEDDTPMDGTVSDSDPNQLARQKAKQALKNIREKDREELKKIAKRAKHAKPQFIDEEFNRVFAERKNKKQTFSLARRKKTTAKDRISERLLSNRAKVTNRSSCLRAMMMRSTGKHRLTSGNK